MKVFFPKKNITKALTLFLLLCSFTLVFSQDKKHFSIVFYNVENLFDTINSQGINDSDFTPEGRYNWDTEKYFDKIEKISEVLFTIDSTFPDIVGLCEIENRQVLEDLIKNPLIKDATYSIVHEDSPDPRGIDVALLYRPNSFTYIYHRAIPVSYTEGARAATRDILYVKGVVSVKDTLHLFVNHWSSRRGGAEASESKRIAAAQILRNVVDSLFTIDKKANIIIMGDFNDNPNNKSISETLYAGGFSKKMDKNKLINLHLEAFEKGEGTLVFNNEWFLFDHIIVSYNLTQKKRKGIYLKNIRGEILKEDFLLFTNRSGQVSLNRTYVGGRFVGGYSDHLPVYVKFLKK